MTKAVNHLYYCVCVLVAVVASLPPDWVKFVPPHIAPYIVGAVIVAAWLKSHWNLFVNPDGTNCGFAYRPNSVSNGKPYTPPAR